MDPIIAWALAIMLSWAPPGRSLIKDAVETPEQGKARYAEIARAAAGWSAGPMVSDSWIAIGSTMRVRIGAVQRPRPS